MTRRRFLEAAGIGAVGLGPASMVLGGTAHASTNPDPSHILGPDGQPASPDAPEIRVLGTASNPQDAVNLQWAMDHVEEGGLVRLSGRFHLSDIDADGNFVHTPLQVRQDFAPWYGDIYLGLPMYFVPGTAQRYVEIEVPAPDGDTGEIVPHYLDPYLGIPVVPTAKVTSKVPVLVPDANDRRIFITRSVRIVGERDGDAYGATIVGGFYTLTIGVTPFDPISGEPMEIRQDFFFDSILNFPWESVRWTAPDPSQPWMGYVDPDKTLEVAIEDLEFTDARGGTILCSATTGFTLVGNRFADMRSLDLASWALEPYTSFAGIHHPEAYFVIVPSMGQSTIPEISDTQVTGNLVLSDNLFDGRVREVPVTPKGDGPCPAGCFEQHVVVDHATLATETYCVPGDANAQLRAYPQEDLPDVLGWAGATAAARLMLMSADVLIARNTVVDMQGLAFGCESNRGTTLITDNHVEVSAIPEGADEPWVLFVSDSHWSGQRDLSQSTVTDNTIVASSAYSQCIVVADTDGAVVTGNTIDLLDPRQSALGMLALGTTGSTFSNNEIRGSADVDFLLASSFTLVPPGPCSGNEFVGNTIAKTTANLTYLLDFLTFDNVVRGYTGGDESVLDLNPFGPYADSPNLLTGVTPMSGAGGGAMRETVQQRAEATARWRDTLKALRERFGHLAP